MSSTPGQSPPPTIAQIPAELEPADIDEGGLRAVFFTSELLLGCGDFLRSYIARCVAGEFGDSLAQTAVRPVNDRDFSSAIKELACVSIYLTMQDQGGASAPRWLLDFLGGCLRVTDKLIFGPPASEILQTHEISAGSELMAAVAASVLARLRLSTVKAAAALPIEEFLSQSGQLRFQLLSFSLEEKADQIKQRLHLAA